LKGFQLHAPSDLHNPIHYHTSSLF
jgi:hypothetical protein